MFIFGINMKYLIPVLDVFYPFCTVSLLLIRLCSTCSIFARLYRWYCVIERFVSSYDEQDSKNSEMWMHILWSALDIIWNRWINNMFREWSVSSERKTFHSVESWNDPSTWGKLKTKTWYSRVYAQYLPIQNFHLFCMVPNDVRVNFPLKNISFKCWNIIFVLFWSGFFKGFVDFRWFGDFPANYNFFESTTCFCHYTNRRIRDFSSTEFGVARLIRDLFVRSMAMIRSSTYASWFHKAKKMRNISVVMKLVSYRWDKASSG